MAALCAMLLPHMGAAAAPAEYEVKAAFIHNIAKFVEWPAAPPADGKLRLCILGEDPFGEAIGVLRGKPVGRLVWEVLPVNSPNSLKDCQALFIAASESGNLRQIQQRIEGGGVLTVGDSRGYAEQGVMVNFYLEENKVRFEINREAAGRAGFRISSHLLKLARIVPESGGRK